MTAPQGTLRMQQQAQTITFQVEGCVRMPQGLALRRFAEQCLAANMTVFRIDLRLCTYMDSTFLGTLLFLHRTIARGGEGALFLVAPSPQCAQLLRQMGLDNVFATARATEPATGTWTELSGAPDDAEAFKRTVVQAHEELATLPGAAGEAFRAVTRCLGEERAAEKVN
jgi:anti-anti-sigma factor